MNVLILATLLMASHLAQAQSMLSMLPPEAAKELQAVDPTVYSKLAAMSPQEASALLSQSGVDQGTISQFNSKFGVSPMRSSTNQGASPMMASSNSLNPMAMPQSQAASPMAMPQSMIASPMAMPQSKIMDMSSLGMNNNQGSQVDPAVFMNEPEPVIQMNANAAAKQALQATRQTAPAALASPQVTSNIDDAPQTASALTANPIVVPDAPSNPKSGSQPSTPQSQQLISEQPAQQTQQQIPVEQPQQPTQQSIQQQPTTQQSIQQQPIQQSIQPQPQQPIQQSIQPQGPPADNSASIQAPITYSDTKSIRDSSDVPAPQAKPLPVSCEYGPGELYRIYNKILLGVPTGAGLVLPNGIAMPSTERGKIMVDTLSLIASRIRDAGDLPGKMKEAMVAAGVIMEEISLCSCANPGQSKPFSMTNSLVDSMPPASQSGPSSQPFTSSNSAGPDIEGKQAGNGDSKSIHAIDETMNLGPNNNNAPKNLPSNIVSQTKSENSGIPPMSSRRENALGAVQNNRDFANGPLDPNNPEGGNGVTGTEHGGKADGGNGLTGTEHGGKAEGGNGLTGTEHGGKAEGGNGLTGTEHGGKAEGGNGLTGTEHGGKAEGGNGLTGTEHGGKADNGGKSEGGNGVTGTETGGKADGSANGKTDDDGFGKAAAETGPGIAQSLKSSNASAEKSNDGSLLGQTPISGASTENSENSAAPKSLELHLFILALSLALSSTLIF